MELYGGAFRSDDIISECKKSDNIIIYGAGMIADILYFYLEEYSLQDRIRGFVVTKLTGNVQLKFGFTVYEMKDMLDIAKMSLILIAVQNDIALEIEKSVHEYNVKQCIRIDADELLSHFYNKLYQQPISDTKVLLQNECGHGYGCNPKYIAEQLHQKDSNLDLVWAVSSDFVQMPEYIRKVVYGSREYYSELATARIWIDNCRKPLSVKKRKGQYYVQAWHGAAPIKMVEKDAMSTLPSFYIKAAKQDSQMADVFLSGSRFYTELYRRSFWYQGLILEYGLPRQDIFWNTSSAHNKIHKLYGIDEDALIVMYAPTFRESYEKICYDIDLNGVVEALEKRFHKQVKMLVSRHPINYQQYHFDDNAEYTFVGDYEDFQELLAATDILISDYSGCVYDFSFTGRPIFLYQRDYEEYLQERNFYIPMDKLPYISAHSNEELKKTILNFEQEKYQLALKKFMDMMHNFDDGYASEKVADFLLKNVLKRKDM